MMSTMENNPKNLVLVIADMARSKPPMESSFVAELSRRLQEKGSALILAINWMEQHLAEEGLGSITMIQAGESALTPSFVGSAVHNMACSTDATFITTMSTRLEATPIISAGIASNSMVLARGWSMMISLYKTVLRYFAH